MAGESRTTTDHAEIRRWVESRAGRPANLKSTESGDILRIRTAGVGDDHNLEDMDWDAFFEKFEVSALAFLYQDKTREGETSRFFKLVRR
jgi:hypothetical protein